MLLNVRSVVLCIAAYVAGFVAALFVFVLTNGIEGNPDDFLPFYAVFGVLLGRLIGRWWLLPLPALHLYVVDPFQDSPDLYDPLDYVLAATIGIAIGVIAKLITRRRTTRAPAASRAQHH